MNKQTNIYRNYIFYHLADGRILANMPTVGDMIFKDESEFKAYIDGYLITQKFFDKIENELRHAVAKHPKFCDNFTEDNGMIWQTREECAKTRNAKMEPTADSILFEEIAEAFNAYQHGDKKNALKEFAQVGAVVLRCMEYIQKEIKE
jgi:hypothetical protein